MSPLRFIRRRAERLGGGSFLGDELGPHGQRLVNVVSACSVVIVAVLLWLALRRLADKGQLAAKKWDFVTNWQVQRFLLNGLVATVKVAVVAMVMALVVGLVLALGRVAPRIGFRTVAGTLVEFFRAVPLLLLILFVAQAFPKWGLRIGAFWYLAVALTAYNGAVLGEIFRAGILSLDRGQSEAAYALGMGWWQTMLLVVVPQALRRMIPAVVSQLVTLLKDTSLGLVIPYEELLRRGELLGEDVGAHQPLLQSLVEVGVLYIAVNLTLSRLATRLEVRQRQAKGGVAAPAAIEDLALLDVEAEAGAKG